MPSAQMCRRRISSALTQFSAPVCFAPPRRSLISPRLLSGSVPGEHFFLRRDTKSHYGAVGEFVDQRQKTMPLTYRNGLLANVSDLPRRDLIPVLVGRVLPGMLDGQHTELQTFGHPSLLEAEALSRFRSALRRGLGAENPSAALGSSCRWGIRTPN